MKEIKAFIRIVRAIEACNHLRAKGFSSMTLSECEGTGVYNDPIVDFPTFNFPFMHSKVAKIEIVCLDEDVEPIVEIIQKHGRTGFSGDGIIYVVDVVQAYRVKDSTTGEDALKSLPQKQ